MAYAHGTYLDHEGVHSAAPLQSTQAWYPIRLCHYKKRQNMIRKKKIQCKTILEGLWQYIHLKPRRVQ